jgi:hypothetical protein
MIKSHLNTAARKTQIFNNKSSGDISCPNLPNSLLIRGLRVVVHTVIPILRGLRQEDYEFETRLGCIDRPCLKTTGAAEQQQEVCV